MSTLDEITKEKQRVSEALARVDAQRQMITSQIAELEATERVLVRYSKGSPTRRTGSAKASGTASAGASARSRGRPRRMETKANASRGTSPSLGDQILALANGRTRQEIAAACPGVRAINSVSPSPGKSGRAASKSATVSSMRRNPTQADQSA